MSTSSAFHVHQLSVEVPHTNNPRVFRVFDTSIYDETIPVKCPLLQITSPGFNAPRDIEILPNFNLVLNACTLGIQTAGCGDTSEILPDGIYHIRYSVSPNDKIFVEYDYLRVTQFYNRYYQKLADLEIAACQPSVDVKKDLEQLRLIKSFIDAAKAKVEYTHENKEAMEILLYAQKLMMKMDGIPC